jgi:hypothetical protein
LPQVSRWALWMPASKASPLCWRQKKAPADRRFILELYG